MNGQRPRKTVEQIVADLKALQDAQLPRTRCDCGCAWSEHTQNPTTPDWLHCGRCDLPCFND